MASVCHVTSIDGVEAPLPLMKCFRAGGGFVCGELHLFLALDRLSRLALDEQQTVSGDVRRVGITFVKRRPERDD